MACGCVPVMRKTSVSRTISHRIVWINAWMDGWLDGITIYANTIYIISSYHLISRNSCLHVQSNRLFKRLFIHNSRNYSKLSMPFVIQYIGYSKNPSMIFWHAHAINNIVASIRSRFMTESSTLTPIHKAHKNAIQLNRESHTKSKWLFQFGIRWPNSVARDSFVVVCALVWNREREIKKL